VTARFTLPILLLLAPAIPLHADLTQAQAEPNLEKRSKLALDNAAAALKSARTAYADGETNKVQTLLTEVGQSVDLAQSSLQQTGKNPRKSPKYFKRAEIETRALLKKVEAFQDEMNVSDRPMLDALRGKVQQVHDDLLMGIMEG